MVEVVTLEEFAELRKIIEESLDAIDRKLNDLIKDVNEKHSQTQAGVEEAVKGLNERIDEVTESSKGFVDRLREAIRPRATEPPPAQTESNPIGKTEKTLGKVADLIMRCPNFFDWDYCQEHCPMYLFCDNIASVHDVSKLSERDSSERFKGLLKHLEAFFRSNREE